MIESYESNQIDCGSQLNEDYHILYAKTAGIYERVDFSENQFK